MLKDKTIKIFDVENIKAGSFITFSRTYIEDGVLEPGTARNGIISEVSETRIWYVDVAGETHFIDVREVLEDEILILGVKERV